MNIEVYDSVDAYHQSCSELKTYLITAQDRLAEYNTDSFQQLCIVGYHNGSEYIAVGAAGNHFTFRPKSEMAGQLKAGSTVRIVPPGTLNGHLTIINLESYG